MRTDGPNNSASKISVSRPDVRCYSVMPPTPSGKSILVVDDEIAIQQILTTALQLGGHSVFAAYGREEVLRYLTTHHFDLVVTDVVMPEFDGTEVIRSVKKLQPDAKIIAMSGGSEYMPRELCLELGRGSGVSAILRKPLRLEHLIHAVDHAFGGSENSAAVPANSSTTTA